MCTSVHMFMSEIIINVCEYMLIFQYLFIFCICKYLSIIHMSLTLLNP